MFWVGPMDTEGPYTRWMGWGSSLESRPLEGEGRTEARGQSPGPRAGSARPQAGSQAGVQTERCGRGICFIMSSVLASRKAS